MPDSAARAHATDLTAVALKGAGESQRAAEYADKAAKFNGLNFNYAFVRNDARELAGT